MEFLKTFDQYGIRPALFYKGKNRKGTSFGCFLTTMLLLVTIACFFYFGQNLYNRKNPSMSYHEEYDANPASFTLNPVENPILLELNSFNGVTFFTDPTMISAIVSQFTIKKLNDASIVEITSYNMEICNESHISGLEEAFRDYFSKKNLANFFCLPRNVKNLTMRGGLDQEIFQAIKFSFEICRDKSSCLSKEIIKKTMSRGYIGVYFLDIAVDAGNYEQPRKTIIKEVFTNYVMDSQKEIDIYYKNNYLNSEEGMVFEENVVEKMVNYDEFHELNFMVEDNEFLQIYLKIKQMKAIYERGYSKIQDLLGLLGGFLNFFYLFGVLLNLLYVRLILITDILLDIFTIKIINSKRKIKKNYKEKIKENIENIKENKNEKIMENFLEKIEENIEENIKEKTPEIGESERIINQESYELSEFPLKNKEKIITNWKPAKIFFKLTELPHKNGEKIEFPQKDEFLKKNEFLQKNEFQQKNEYLQKEIATNKLPPKILDLEEIDFGKGPPSLKHLDVFTDKLQRSEPIYPLETPDFTEIETLNLRILDYVYIYTGLFKTKEREQKKLMINKGNEILKKCLDVKYIIRKFYEIEKLKNLILSDSQLDLFRFLPKPEIIINLHGDDDEKSRHSVHTRVLKRSSSFERDVKVDEKRKKKAVLKNSGKSNKISRKLTLLTT